MREQFESRDFCKQARFTQRWQKCAAVLACQRDWCIQQPEIEMLYLKYIMKQ